MSTATRVVTTARSANRSKPKSPTSDLIAIGKDVLELLSSAMYVDPLTIYREYIQNAADAIDDARRDGVLDAAEPGQVDIGINAADRSIRIRDNGCGIPADRAAAILLSIGASGKRGTGARGFRGVGRLAGLAYCRLLTFRTRAAANQPVIEVAWDCVKLKSALRDVTQTDDLRSVMQRIVSISEVDGSAFPEHFFEVELTQVVRLRKDALLNPSQIETYLAQVAPVPFAPDFSYAARISAHLGERVRMADLQIQVGAEGLPITRPYRNAFAVTDTVQDRASELELLTFESENGLVALGWLLHHGYLGHISSKSQVGGLRLRSGNVQIGAANLADEIFPEARFNGWSIGELHVIDRRVLPNARRDDFEQNIHYSNLLSELVPVGRAIAKRCRDASVARHHARTGLASPPTAEGVRIASLDLDRNGQVGFEKGVAQAVLAGRVPHRSSAQTRANRDVVAGFSNVLATLTPTRDEAVKAFEQALTQHFDAR